MYNLHSGSTVRRYLSSILPLLLLLTACAPVPSLWGVYATPTQEFSAAPLSTAAVLFSSPSPTASAQPTLTFTLTPTPTGIETATPQPLTGGGTEPLLVEAIFTPTFDVAPVLYYAQSGDTLAGIAARFGLDASEVHSEGAIPQSGLVPPGTLLIMPDRLAAPTSPGHHLIPDSEVVFSGTAADFDISAYIEAAGGRLSAHREYLGSTGWNTGADEFRRLAFENSINPRLLLALLEYESRWVRADAMDAVHRDYPMGYINLYYKGLFGQMLWAVNQLSVGYYGWRTGALTELQFPDGTRLRLNPELNAGTVALQYLFSKQHNQSQWSQMIDPGNGFLAVYTEMFGDPWARADSVEPLLPPGLAQPALELPFDLDIGWSYTGGPHGAWEHDGALAAIDFAPFTDHGGCDTTTTWVTAAAPGMIVRSERGVVIQDLDGDGFEQTGWALVYLHVASSGRVAAGTYVEQDDRIGHASCEGGQATGTHLHFVRKYNGEWVAADGPIPFVLSGWTVKQGRLPYEGTMVKAGKVITADPVGQLKSVIIRTLNDD
jgi:murein DD-endopeptidase MepM/ murein hydrolase activator NlpD